ncbi:MAG: helix-turn-helix domain-containing protein [Candidatus Bathyarchaeia archaeon]
MARKGYAIEGQYPSRILNLLSEEKPGIRWSEIWRRSGISKPTLAKYLKLLVGNGYVLQEDGFYRANPSHEIPAVEGRRAFETAYRNRIDDINKWTHQTNEEKGIDESLETMSDPTRLREFVGRQIARISVQFIIALDEIVRIHKRSAARENIDLFLKIDVIPMLQACARDIWEHRNRVPVRSLDGYVAHLQAGEKYLEEEESK